MSDERTDNWRQLAAAVIEQAVFDARYPGPYSDKYVTLRDHYRALVWLQGEGAEMLEVIADVPAGVVRAWARGGCKGLVIPQKEAHDRRRGKRR